MKNKLRQLLQKKFNGNVPPQERIAYEIGITHNTLSRWMNQRIDRFDADVVTKFCDYLQCDVGDLLYIDRSENPVA